MCQNPFPLSTNKFLSQHNLFAGASGQEKDEEEVVEYDDLFPQGGEHWREELIRNNTISVVKLSPILMPTKNWNIVVKRVKKMSAFKLPF